MALFDSALKEARAGFDLGDRADQLLAALLALITDKDRGGFKGFLDRTGAAGLVDATSSWISSGANASISNQQTEAALGPVTLDDISKKTGIDYQTTVAACALMLPHIVNELTPDGAAPSDEELRAKTYGLIPETDGSAAETFDRIGTAAVGTIEEKEENTMEEFDDNDDKLRWLLPLIILVLLVIFGFWFCGKH